MIASATKFTESRITLDDLPVFRALPANLLAAALEDLGYRMLERHVSKGDFSNALSARHPARPLPGKAAEIIYFYM
jgi:hypothetical protein